MANIKFSQFTVGNTESDIDFVVGYKGANNIQISPANLLSATLTGYLPLTGGTMSGNIVFTDNVQAQFGTANDLRLVHNGSDSYIQQTGVGDLILQQTVTDADISFQADNGSGGITEYFKLDGNIANGTYVYTVFPDNSRLTLGSGTDLRLWHSGTQSYLQNYTGQLNISVNAPDEDIRFYADDGSGAITEYFRVDGGTERIESSKSFRFADGARVQLGASSDFQIYHDGTNSFIDNSVGNLYITNYSDNEDIIFGAGGVTAYITLDGSNVRTRIDREMRFMDTIPAKFGTSGDLAISHDSSNTRIENFTGALKIINNTNDGDIEFYSDDGSGGIAEYFRLDGGDVKNRFSKSVQLGDNVYFYLGDQQDLGMFHNGTSTVINNNTGNLTIKNSANNSDIVFQCDDGAGGIITYFQLDGGLATGGTVYTVFPDNSRATFGAGYDLQIYHDATNSYIKQGAGGNLIIQQETDDGDISFQSDDGSGSVAEYFRLDGSSVQTIAEKDFRFIDNAKVILGTGSDLEIFHNGTDSSIRSFEGDLIIRNADADKDILFQADGGSGSPVEYMRLDGSQTTIRIKRQAKWDDNIKATFGDSDDLQIYHDGSNSFISDTGIGDLRILGSVVRLKSAGDENMIVGVENAGVTLYYDAVAKLTTTSTGVKITGVLEYADNTAAIAGGLTTGQLYRTGDLLKIVH